MNAKQPRSIRQLAKSTGYSVGEVQRRRARGESDTAIKRAAKSRDTQRGGKASTSRGETFPEAQARKESALADKHQMQAAKMRAELLDAGEIKLELSGLVLDARTRFLSMGAELCDVLAGMSDPIAIRCLIDDYVCRALDALSKYNPCAADPAESENPKEQK
jgi:hypothetical protein